MDYIQIKQFLSDWDLGYLEDIWLECDYYGS